MKLGSGRCRRTPRRSFKKFDGARVESRAGKLKEDRDNDCGCHACQLDYSYRLLRTGRTNLMCRQPIERRFVIQLCSPVAAPEPAQFALDATDVVAKPTYVSEPRDYDHGGLGCRREDLSGSTPSWMRLARSPELPSY